MKILDLKKPYIFIFLILIFSFFTYFINYDKPNLPFWDEHYHIPAAQKYIDGVMFMEPHPPLGKLLIALGEVIFRANKDIDTSAFLGADLVMDFPEGFSFVGVRFFPALFGYLSSVLFFLILYFISKKPLLAFLFSFLYMFENALIVHFRGAMLDGIQIFFILGAILYFVIIFNDKVNISKKHYLIFGIISGLAVSVKITSLILVLLFFFLLFKEFTNENKGNKKFINFIKKAFLKVIIYFAGLLIVFFSIWYIHFAIGNKVYNERYYKASYNYQKALHLKQTANLIYFLDMLKDSIIYFNEYEKSIPTLKNEENSQGSNPLGWPVGIKSILYRWSGDGNKIKYLYFQGNPVNWVIGLISIIISIILIIRIVFFKIKIKNKNNMMLIIFFSILYFSYILAMLMIRRVMFLFHYLIPLIFVFIISFIVFEYFFGKKDLLNSKYTFLIVNTLIGLTIIAYLFFSPLTYYRPLSKTQLEKRNIIKYWDIVPVDVKKTGQ